MLTFPLMRHLFPLLMLIALALPAWGQDRPRAGLMWNHSGLPATLPLVVKTMPGHDYAVFLAAPEGGDPVMAGYIHGGTFFRLLVPPGTWAIRLAHGRDWQDEDALFGPDTEWIALDQPLTFGAGVARRQGHIIRLIETEGKVRVASAGPLDICQALTVTTEIEERNEKDREALNLLPAPGLQDLRDDFHTFPRSDFDRLPTPGLRRIETELDTRSRVCPLD